MYNILTNNNKLDLIKDKDRIINIDYLCTDGHHAYDVISNHILFKDYINNHIVSKKEICLVESYNSSMRDRLARLKRKRRRTDGSLLTIGSLSVA